MHDVLSRQLPLLAAALIWTVAAEQDAPSSHVSRSAQSTAAQELRAAKVLEATVLGRAASPEDWKRLGATYNELVRKHPHDAAIRDARGDYLWCMNDRQCAMREWLMAEQLDPKNVTVLNHLAGAYLAVGEPRRSLAYYLRSCEMQPTDAIAHFNAANVACMFRHEVGRSEEEAFGLALRHFAEAHRLEPKNSDFARAYAETFYLLPHSDWKIALKVWEHYLKIAPEKNFALLNLARVHMKLGNRNGARAYLAQVQGADYERQRARLGARIEAELGKEERGQRVP